MRTAMESGILTLWPFRQIRPLWNIVRGGNQDERFHGQRCVDDAGQNNPVE